MQTFGERNAYAQPSEKWFIDYLNEHEDGVYEKDDGWQPTKDVKGPSTYEIKSFRADSNYVTVAKKTYMNCDADYYAFVEVNRDGSVTGYAIVAPREHIDKAIKHRLDSGEQWFGIKDEKGIRYVISFDKFKLMEESYAIYVSPSTKGKIADMLSEKMLKDL